MKHGKWAIPVLIGCILPSGILFAQAAAGASTAGPDVLVLKDGEKIIGHLESATASSIVFKSDGMGEVKVDWSKVQELRSDQHFAVIPKGVKLRNSSDRPKVPQGAIAVTDQTVQVKPSAGAEAQHLPAGNVAEVVPEAAFQNAFQHQSFLHGWKGGATAGLSLTEATQKNQTITSALNLVRTTPGVDWLDVRSRTIFDYNQAYGKLTQPGSPAVKTSLVHAGAEQDWYLSPRVFVFGQAMFDHSFSQGLQLMQTYGGGLGLVVFKTENQELDFKASADYIDQRFEVASLNKRLFGSIFGESYNRTFAHGILLNEQAGFVPAWNEMSAYTAFASAALTFPVYHRFGLTVGALDNFINEPPPGFKKNSFQFTLGATYAFQ